MNMNLIFRCLTVLLTLIGNEAVFAFSGIGNTLDFGELAAFPGVLVLSFFKCPVQ